MVAAYETVSSTHWNAPHLEPAFTPNWCVDITGHIDTKLEALSCYESELDEPRRRSLFVVRCASGGSERDQSIRVPDLDR